MSVYIKGIEMPKHDDEYVIFTVYGDGGVVYGPLNRPHVRYKNRAFPVPDHGRLIDADALVDKHFNKAYLAKAMTASKDEMGTALVNIPLVINNAPTIIPAEEGET